MKKVSNKKVAAVIVTYNRKELLCECIDALLNQDYDNCDILVIDNASTDGTKKSIEKYKDKIKYYNTGKNLGGAGGFNYGMKKAYENGCDFVWLMDDDCIVHKDSLTILMNHAKKLDYNFGFLSSKVLWKDDSICRMNVQKNSLFKKNSDWTTSRMSVIMATFVSFLVPTNVIEDVGFPITDFFIWADDLEYSRRISRKYNCYLINDSVVTHKSKNNIGSNIAIDESDNLSRYNYSYRNERYIFRREGLIGKLYYFLKINYHRLKILKANSKNKKERLNIIKNAAKVGKTFNPPIEYIPYDKKRILYMYGEWLNSGGQETFTLNVLNNINKDKIVIDLFTPYTSRDNSIIEAVKNENGKIYAYNGRFENERGDKKDFYNNTKSFLKEYGKRYDIVHIHSGSTFSLALGAKLAKKYGIKKVIVHSHCTGYKNLKYKIVKFISYYFFKKYVDVYCACSNDALYWKFSNKLINDSNHFILKNGIEVEKFLYDEKVRNEYRNKLNLKNRFVISNVARLCDQKNQQFLLEVFNVVHKLEKKSLLLLVGDGPNREMLENKTKELGLVEDVVFLGKRNDIPNLLQASDIFVFPSVFEGLGISVIESQTNGLMTICSENIPMEAFITDLCIKMNLNSSYEEWADEIVKHKEYKRKNMKKEIDKSGYNINSLANDLEELYLSDKKR